MNEKAICDGDEHDIDARRLLLADMEKKYPMLVKHPNVEAN